MGERRNAKDSTVIHDPSNSSTTADTLWFYADSNNEAQGPLPFAELQRLATAGTILPETHVIEKGGSEWRSYESVSCAQPCAVSSAPKRSSRKSILRVALIFLLALSAIGGGVAVFEKFAGKQSPRASERDFIVPKGTSLYADEKTLNELQTQGDRGGEAGTEALKRLDENGKVWSAEANIIVSIVRKGGPMGSILLNAKKAAGKRAQQFWALGTELLPISDPRAQHIMRTARQRSEFKWVFDGTNGDVVGDAGVENLGGLLQGLYDGRVTLKQASKAVFELAVTDAEFKQIIGDYLIYEVVSNQ